MEDLPCPNGCGGTARWSPKVGDSRDYECPRSLAFSVRALAAAFEALVAMRRRSSGERLAALVLPPMRPSSTAASCWEGVKRRIGSFFIQ